MGDGPMFADIRVEINCKPFLLPVSDRSQTLSPPILLSFSFSVFLFSLDLVPCLAS
jgi:hypothetical protein